LGFRVAYRVKNIDPVACLAVYEFASDEILGVSASHRGASPLGEPLRGGLGEAAEGVARGGGRETTEEDHGQCASDQRRTKRRAFG
jgi:hypothetical protein